MPDTPDGTFPKFVGFVSHSLLVKSPRKVGGPFKTKQTNTIWKLIGRNFCLSKQSQLAKAGGFSVGAGVTLDTHRRLVASCNVPWCLTKLSLKPVWNKVQTYSPRRGASSAVLCSSLPSNSCYCSVYANLFSSNYSHNCSFFYLLIFSAFNGLYFLFQSQLKRYWLVTHYWHWQKKV